MKIVFTDARRLNLVEALGIACGEVVAFVGGGGKTSAMFRLAAELASRGGRVLVTTTTHIFSPQPKECAAVVLENDMRKLIEAARVAVQKHRVVTVACGIGADGRLAGIDPSFVAQLRDHLPITNLLVEADGSNGRPFKAPAAHEPAIPPCSGVVISVVGLSAVGRSLDAETVHRPECVAALTGAQLGEIVSPAMVASVVRHPEGSARGAPAGARTITLLNQADDAVRLDTGRQVARELIERGAERVVIAALREALPVRELAVRAMCRRPPARRSSVTAIVLAAGEGRRMGQLKLGLRLGEKSILRRVAETALAAEVDEVVVVLGHRAADLEHELPDDARVRTVYNSAYSEGQSSSLRAGINSLRPDADAALFLLGDQPLIDPAVIANLVSAFRTCGAALLQPVYRGAPGHPVLFSRALFLELLQVTGDRGGREVLSRHKSELATIDLDMEMPADVDTMQDLVTLAAKFPGDDKG